MFYFLKVLVVDEYKNIDKTYIYNKYKTLCSNIDIDLYRQDIFIINIKLYVCNIDIDL